MQNPRRMSIGGPPFEVGPDATAVSADRGPGYRRKLLWLLSVATFFEGYDTFVIALVLPVWVVALAVAFLFVFASIALTSTAGSEARVSS
jgi:hypothetical protein